MIRARANRILKGSGHVSILQRTEGLTLAWASHDKTRLLCAVSDGSYLLFDSSESAPLYIGIAADGKVTDLERDKADGGDIENAILAFGCAGLDGMKQRVISWPHRR